MSHALYFQLFVSFLKIGAFSFGGGYAMLPLICGEIVQTRAWLTPEEFVDVIAISQATPGPIGINCATYVGYKVGNLLGSLVATLGVVIPSFVVVLLLGMLFFRYRDMGLVKNLFAGIRPVVVSLILAAAVSVVPSSVTGINPALVAVGVFAGVLFFRLDPVLLLVLSGVLGYFVRL